MSRSRAVHALAVKLDLPVTVIWVLLNAGWQYVEEADCQPKWVKP